MPAAFRQLMEGAMSDSEIMELIISYKIDVTWDDDKINGQTGLTGEVGSAYNRDTVEQAVLDCVKDFEQKNPGLPTKISGPSFGKELGKPIGRILRCSDDGGVIKIFIEKNENWPA